jgi:hypothetical protein
MPQGTLARITISMMARASEFMSRRLTAHLRGV